MTYATKHNGGKTNINPNFVGDDVFWACRTVDIIKSFQTFVYNAGWPNPRDLDTNGYPKESAFSGDKSSLGSLNSVNFVPSQDARVGDYIVKWDGKASITCTLNTGGSFCSLDTTTTGGVNNRLVVTPGDSDDGKFSVAINGVGSDVGDMSSFSNLRACHIDDESLLDAGVMWHPIWLEKLRLFNPGSIRLMNWMAGNTSAFSQFQYRKPKDYINWQLTTVPSADFGMTTNSGTKYSITTGRGSLEHGEMLHCQFNASNPATEKNCTLSNANPMVVDCADHGYLADQPIGFNSSGTFSANVNNCDVYYVLASGLTSDALQVSKTKGGSPISNSGDTASVGMTCMLQPTFNRDGTGDVPLMTEYAGVLGNSTGPTRGTSPDRVYQSTLIYDAAVNRWLLFGNGRWDLGFSGDQYINDGSVPLEWMLDLCAIVGAHPMFSAYVDGVYNSTGLHRDHAQFCKDWIETSGVSWMKYRMEGCNEIWNWPKFGITTTSRYVGKHIIRTGVINDYANPYGWSMTEIGQEVSGVFGGDTSKYDVICGVQAGGLPASNSDPRLDSDDWMAQSSAPDGYVLQPAKDFVTHVCTAQYLSSPLNGNSTEQAMQTAYSDGDTSQLGLYLDTYDDGTNSTFNITSVYNIHVEYKEWGQSKGVNGFTGYEGGLSPDYTISDLTYTLRRDAKQYILPSANFAGGIYHVLQRNFDKFNSLNEPGYVADYPAVFQFEGPKPSNNVWSLQEDIFQPPSEQLKCYGLINRGKRRYIAKVH